MAMKIIQPFLGPLTPTNLETWLGQCEDAFAIYAVTKSEKSPDIDEVTKIRLIGSNMQEPSMAAWWSATRAESLKLKWEAFEKSIRSRFMPKGYKLLALRTFFICEQGNLSFSDYASALADARNAVGTTTITASIYRYQLLFHAHPMLVLRIMAIPDFDIDKTNFDDLVALMSMQWDSLTAEGLIGTRSSGGSRSAPSMSNPVHPTSNATRLPPLTEAEKERLSTLGGCWRCRKAPQDTSWVPHVGRTCPGDAALGISPGRDYVPPAPVSVKKEPVGAVFLTSGMFHDSDGEDQPDTYDEPLPENFYQDDDTD